MMKVNAASLFAGALLGSDPLAGSGDQSGEVALFRKLFQRFAQMGDGAKHPATAGQPAADTSKLCSPLAATILSDPTLAESLPATETAGELASPFPSSNVGTSIDTCSGPFPQLETTVDTTEPTQVSQPLPQLEQGGIAPQNPFLIGVSISTQSPKAECPPSAHNTQQAVAPQIFQETAVSSAHPATVESILPQTNLTTAQTDSTPEPPQAPESCKHPQPSQGRGNSQAGAATQNSEPTQPPETSPVRLGKPAVKPSATQPRSPQKHTLAREQKPSQDKVSFKAKSDRLPSLVSPDAARAFPAKTKRDDSNEESSATDPASTGNPAFVPVPLATTPPRPVLEAVEGKLAIDSSEKAMPAVQPSPTPQPRPQGTFTNRGPGVELASETEGPQPPRPELIKPSHEGPSQDVSSVGQSEELPVNLAKLNTPQPSGTAQGSDFADQKPKVMPRSSSKKAARADLPAIPAGVTRKAAGTGSESQLETFQPLAQEPPKPSPLTVVSPQTPTQASGPRTQPKQKPRETTALEPGTQTIDYGTSPPPTPPSLDGTAWAKARQNRAPHLSVVGKPSADGESKQAPASSDDPSNGSSNNQTSGQRPAPPERRMVHLTLVTPFPGQKSSAPAKTFQAAWPKLPENFAKTASPASGATDPVTRSPQQAPVFTAKVINLELPGKPAPVAGLQTPKQSQPQPALLLKQGPAAADFTRHLVSYSPTSAQTREPGLTFSQMESESTATPNITSHLAKSPAPPAGEPPSGFPIKQPSTLESLKPNLSATLANTQPIQISPGLAQPRTPVTQSFNLLALEAGQQQAQPTARFQPIKVVTSTASATTGTPTLGTDSSAGAAPGLEVLPSSPSGGQANLAAANIFERPVSLPGADNLITPLFKQKSESILFAPGAAANSEASPEEPGPVFRLGAEKTPTGTALNLATVSNSHNPNVEKLDKMGVESVSRLLEHRLTKPDQPTRQKLELELDPERLGALKIEISVDPVSKKVETHLIVSHESAKEALEHQFPVLRQRLSEHGIHMESRFSLASENGNSADKHGGGRNYQGQKKSTLAGDMPTESEGSSAAQASGNLYA